MSRGELLTSVTVWVAIAGYALGTFVFAWSRKRDRWDAWARLAWTLGCIGMLAHTACAFQFYHGWSHAAAYQDTARQTAEMFGLDWGGGLLWAVFPDTTEAADLHGLAERLGASAWRFACTRATTMTRL